MKRCYQSVSWESGAGFALSGLSLGFDRRTEHVEGISPLLRKLGVPVVDFPVGLEDRQMAGAPPALRFVTYDFEPRDRRRRGYPAALLYLVDSAMDPAGGANPLSSAEVVRRYDLEFMTEPVQKNHDTSHDLVTAWGAGGFAVHVRGPRNIFLLKRLHEAILAGDVAVLAPVASGSSAGTLRLVIASMMGVQDKEQLVADDEASEVLLRAAADTGIHALLLNAGCRYQALKPEWFDEQHDEVIFCLEPEDVLRFNCGWFSLTELRAWSKNLVSPVFRYPTLERLITEPQYANWESRLIHGLARIGAVPRYGVKLTWLDMAGRVPAVSYRATRATEHILSSGSYAFHALMKQHAIPLGQDLRRAEGRSDEKGERLA